jgi:hypothetical protein
MSILNQLSSQLGDRTETSNHKVALQCLEHPELLGEIAAGLDEPVAALVGDCAEVMTKVAQDHPEFILPYVDLLPPLLVNKYTRVRWEAAHALSLVATRTPGIISSLLPLLMDKLRTDPSVIVRDHAADTIASYASTGQAAAECAYPLLKEILTLWDGKQAGHALLGLAHVARQLPEKHAELLLVAQEFSHSSRGVVRKAAKALLKELGSP